MPQFQSTKSFFLYVPADSPIHKLHPLTKLVIVFVINLISFFVMDFYGTLCLLALILILLAIGKVPLSLAKSFVMALLGIIQLIMISYLLFTQIPGNIIYFEAYVVLLRWHIYVSDATLLNAFTMDIRLVTLFLTTTFFLATTRDRDLIYGLRKLHIPYAGCLMFSLMFRSMSLFVDDYYIIREAMMSKALDFGKGSIAKRLRRYVFLIIPLMILMVKRTEEIAYAIEARGIPIRGRKRAVYHDFPLTAIDYAVCGVFVSFFLGIVVGKTYLGFNLGDLAFGIIQRFIDILRGFIK